MSETNSRQRLSFEVTPKVDSQAAQDRIILVAEDAWNRGALLIIPREVACQDRDYIDAIMDSRTVGDVRHDSRAWAAASERYDEQRADMEAWDQPASDDLPNDHPYDPDSWFGDEGVIYELPLARLRTAESAPSCLDSLARKDTNSGMDYEPAPWWSVEDVAEVKSLLASNGYEVVDDEELVLRYSNY